MKGLICSSGRVRTKCGCVWAANIWLEFGCKKKKSCSYKIETVGRSQLWNEQTQPLTHKRFFLSSSLCIRPSSRSRFTLFVSLFTSGLKHVARVWGLLVDTQRSTRQWLSSDWVDVMNCDSLSKATLQPFSFYSSTALRPQKQATTL